MKNGAAHYVTIAKEVFAPLYPIVAGRIKEETKITRGRCLDLGAGPGLLGLAMARITDLDVTLLDIDPNMLAFAVENITGSGLDSRVRVLEGDVHQIPFPDDSVDLVISRGSVFFWKDPARAFGEVWRVLVPGGQAWVGGGFGNPELKKRITAEMRRRDPEWEPQARERTSESRMKTFQAALDEAGIEKRTLENGDGGFWIRFTKGTEEEEAVR